MSTPGVIPYALTNSHSTILDAPGLRDDYYCTVLAYCHTSSVVAVGLANRVYLWSEEFGVRYPPLESRGHHSTYVTSISFSSEEGGHSILAVGRNNGQLSLWSLGDSENIRFSSQQPSAIACVAFKPVTIRRPSEKFGSLVPMEDLLVGDEVGNIYYYSIEWSSPDQVDIHGWSGHMKLLARIEAHTQQICGIAWAANGDYFATGANDNLSFIFEVKALYREIATAEQARSSSSRRGFANLLESALSPISNVFVRNIHAASSIPPQSPDFQFISRPHDVAPPNAGTSASLTTTTPILDAAVALHKLPHSAAIKALAFCPWSASLLATGGGSNDRQIHFFHVHSGATLATINVHAQVTSLIWNPNRREICATFGYPQPDHGFRIALFSWPGCRQLGAVMWPGELRALMAVGYPGTSATAEARRAEKMRGKDERNEKGPKTKKRRGEGCIVVAGSDECVRFHEVWSSGGGSRVGGGRGGLLGSEILDGLEGSDTWGGEIIR